MTVFQTILSEINNDVYFVFPSEVAAVIWARRICGTEGVRSLALNRFMAWDRFKEEAVRTEVKNKKPVSALIRKLFARRLVRENAASPFLASIIPENVLDTFKINGDAFAPSIAAMLPSLAFWEEKQQAFQDDGEDRDLRIIKIKYVEFLESRGLFEPAWEKAPPAFPKTGRKYIIFFPEALDDFSEYRELLDCEAITVYSVDNLAGMSKLLFFESARTELRTAAMELRRLHEEEHISYEDMAVSLPDYSRMEPYVSRELALHDIPFSRRAGKNLGDYPAGNIFSLLGECASSLFSFDSLKPFLLDSGIPWKDPRLNRALIRFGVENHCVSPFRDKGRLSDPWEEGFKKFHNDPEIKKLSAYYAGLKQAVTAMASAKSFRKILEQYFVFRSFLDMNQCGPESDAVLARCVEELVTLIETENEYPELADANPFGFYSSHLNEKNYVYTGGGGVNIYDYPVAAGAPFSCHMVLNASQTAAEHQHRPLSYLRPDKRARLKVEDRDISPQLLALYSVGPWKSYVCRTRISASEKSFTGWAIPHSAFALNLERYEETSGSAPDLYTEEQHWWAEYGDDADGKLSRLYSIQRGGFENWSRVLLSEQDDARGVFSPSTVLLLRKKIAGKNRKNLYDETLPAENGEPGFLSVSATDLTEFFSCPALWLYKRIFHLEPYREDAALVDDESLGLFYHDILYFLFKRIQEQDEQFIPSHLDLYCAWTEEITASVLRQDEAAKGAFLSSLTTGMTKRLRALLKTEADNFAGYAVEALEQDYSQTISSVRINGRIDRVSSRNGKPVIIDYKTNYTPGRKKSRIKECNGETGLDDFQIAMYVKLYEAASGKKADTACFISINKHEIVPVIGSIKGKRDLCGRDEYESTLGCLEKGIGVFEKAVSVPDFSTSKMKYKTCTSCDYKKMCRSLYYLNPREKLFGGQGTVLPGAEDEEDGDES